MREKESFVVSDETCQTCQFSKGTRCKDLFCLRYPPVLWYEVAAGGAQVSANFVTTVVRPEGWCGEYKSLSNLGLINKLTEILKGKQFSKERMEEWSEKYPSLRFYWRFIPDGAYYLSEEVRLQDTRA